MMQITIKKWQVRKIGLSRFAMQLTVASPKDGLVDCCVVGYEMGAWRPKILRGDAARSL
jgi:hypothetical protein